MHAWESSNGVPIWPLCLFQPHWCSVGERGVSGQGTRVVNNALVNAHHIPGGLRLPLWVPNTPDISKSSGSGKAVSTMLNAKET